MTRLVPPQAFDAVQQGNPGSPLTEDEALRMKMLMLELEKKIDGMKMNSTHPGSRIYDMLASKNVNFDTSPVLCEVLERIIAVVGSRGQWRAQVTEKEGG